ncbi:MAG: hypothetical protein ACI30A_06605 [Paludibacteraceae bacterium]
MLNDLYITPTAPEPLDTDPSEENPNEDYQFVTGELPPDEQLEAFLQEFNAEKEDTGAADEPDPELDDPGNDEEAISLQTARNTASFIVNTIDDAAALGLGYISMEPPDNHRAGKAQKKNLENLFTRFCKEKGAEIPLGWQITFCLATVYAAQIPHALDKRKINQARIEMEKREQALNQREEELQRRELENDKQYVRLINMKQDLHAAGSQNN